MADLTKREVFAEAIHKTATIRTDVESRKKKLIENAAVVISFSVIALSIILYAFNKGYCKVFNLPPEVMSLDMTQMIPLAIQILSIATCGLLYFSSLKADHALKKNRIDLVRIIWGSFILSYFFALNNVSAVIGKWWNIILIYALPALVEVLRYSRRKPKKNAVISEAEHNIVLEDTVRDTIFATYYIKYGIFLVVIPMFFAPYCGEFCAKAEREYQTCIVQDATYAVIVDYSDRVLVQQAYEQGESLQIDTSSYTYFDKKDIILRYSKYESVSIDVDTTTAQPPSTNESWIKIKEGLGMPTITDWLMVIITFVYVVATIFICWANIKSARAARDQLAEAKRQFEEDSRPNITYEMFYENRTYYGLRFTNHGKRIATNVKISLNKEFIDSLNETTFADFLKKLDGKEFLLGVGQSYSIYFGGAAFRDNLEKLPIQGVFSYRDGEKHYDASIFVDFNLYPTFFSTTSDSEKMIKALRDQSNELQLLRKEIVELKSSKLGPRKRLSKNQ